MALKKSLTDPLNWLLLLLGAAFVYYIFAVPYFTEFYLKTPQQMTLAEYLANPSHPRPFMAHALSTPPPSIEIVITGLTVRHVDQDSILLEDPNVPAWTSPEPAAAPAAADPEGATTAGGNATAAAPAASRGGRGQEQAAPALAYLEEAPVPNNQILIAGENLDLVGVSPGQTVSLRAYGLHMSPLGWVPQEVTIASDQEEYFSKEELDTLETMALLADGNEISIPYIEVGELRFAGGNRGAGESMALAALANDTTYVQTAQRLGGGGAVDLYDVRLIERLAQDRTPYFVVEDSEGRRARVMFNSRLLSEWYWALDRLGGEEVVVRGTLHLFAPSDLRALETEGNVQAVLDGYEILSRSGDQVGAQVISLENPMGGPGGSQ